jgi:DNA-binding NarL/FixJ family response regulator
MKRIMIVDDSAVMRKNLRTILIGAGYSIVAEATNGEEAYQSYVQCVPDLVTMDVTMPILNGIDAVKKIKADFKDACIIVISAFDQRSMLFDALEHGAKHYIIKPITSEKLLSVVEKVLMEQAIGIEATAGDHLQHKNTAVESAALEPVSITNRNGVFIVSIPLGLQGDGWLPIRTALQGLLLIKPLHIAFDFSDAIRVEESLLTEMKDLLNAITQAGGKINFIARSEGLRDVLRFKYQEIPLSDE